jgi:hypothetical protein
MIRTNTLRAFVAMIACAAAIPSFVRAADEKAPDLSTPKGAAIAFAKAVQDGDKAGVRAVCIGNDEELKAMESMAGAMGAIKKFRTACDDKYGKDNLLTKNFPADQNLTAEAEKAEFKVEGDIAKSIPKPGEDQKDQATLKKVDGKWKIDVASIGKDKLAQAGQMAKIGKVLEDFAAEITAGKYKTVEEAAIAMGPKMQEAMKQ